MILIAGLLYLLLRCTYLFLSDNAYIRDRLRLLGAMASAYQEQRFARYGERKVLGQTLAIRYGTAPSRTVYVPFRRDQCAPMLFVEAAAHFPARSPLDITQEPGVPYLVPAGALNAEFIRLTNLETGKSYDYRGSTCPLWGKEIHDE